MTPASLLPARWPASAAEVAALPPAVLAGAAAVALAGVVVAVLAARFLARGGAPRRRRHAIGTAAQLRLEPGKMKEVTVPLGGAGGKEATVLLVRTSRGQLRAMGARCPHYNLPLVQGVVSGDRVMCYAHAACFSSETGDIEDGPSLDRVPSYAVSEDASGQIFVELPEPAAGGDGSIPTREEPHFCAQAAGDARNFVVVGAGPAAQGCAEQLRRDGYTGRITLLTREPLGFAYDRVKLSKKMGEPAEALRSPEFYKRLSISVRTSVTVTALRTEAKQVVLSTGEALAYDKLLCASGGPARTYRADRKEPGPPPIAGAELENIFPLRDAGHAQAVSALLARFKAAGGGAGGASSARVVIVGSSFIGMEAASYLLTNKLAADVSVVGMEDVPMERVLGRNVGEMLLEVGAAKGVKFHMRCTVGRFVAGADGRSVAAVELLRAAAPGSPPGEPVATLPADLVIIGVGIVPAVDYLRGAAGVTVHEAMPGGVKVDAFLCAGPEDVFAAGDIAYLPYPHAEGVAAGAEAPRVRIEHWDVALDQGRAAARNMLGGARSAAYNAVPFFWTSVFGRNLRSAGYCSKPAFLFKKEAGDEIITHGSLDKDTCRASVFYCVGGRVASVVTCNRDPEAAAAAELIRMRRMPAPEALRAQELSLVDVLRQAHEDEAGAAAAASGAGGAAAGGKGGAAADAAARKRRASATAS
jgi:NADPH-dependent 2,4-dienoyl-CoA reductase/sulfur reductase-like enzyme/nitrite reductase/ring-hydroxylating ferredoxin subunit